MMPCQIYIANLAIFKIWVFSATFLHEITLYVIDIDKKRFRTLFYTLEPLCKSALHHTQLTGTSATVSYLPVLGMDVVELLIIALLNLSMFCIFTLRNTKVRYMITQDCYLDKDDYPRRRVVVRARREDQADYVHQRGKELTEVPKICLFQRLHRQYASDYFYILTV